MWFGRLPIARPSTFSVVLVNCSVAGLMVASVRPYLRWSVWQTTQ
jgi:hypothetical protein